MLNIIGLVLLFPLELLCSIGFVYSFVNNDLFHLTAFGIMVLWVSPATTELVKRIQKNKCSGGEIKEG